MSPAPFAAAGTLVLVVGPSGAGKDTLITLAREMIGSRAHIVFPRRVVTRQGSAAEDHDTLTPVAFDEAVRRGTFAFWWEAHGLKYGLPATIDRDLHDGATVVCNVSRAIVPHLRRRYVQCKVVLVDAPREIRAARLAARQRPADGEAGVRLDRRIPADEPLLPDLVIENVGPARDGGHALATLLLGATAPRLSTEAESRLDEISAARA